MAKNTPAVLEEDIVEEISYKKEIEAGISRLTESVTVNGQHFRYKAMRAIAYQAFIEAIDTGEFDGLVDRAISNADDLPRGWELEPASAKAEKPTKKATPAKKAPAEKKAPAAKKAPAKKATAEETPKRAARRRPSRG